MKIRLATLVLVAVVPLLAAGPDLDRASIAKPAAQEAGFSSGGLGRSQADWEAVLGSTGGEPVGLGFFAYPHEGSGTYYVAYEGDLIRYLEWAWPEGESTPFAEMQPFVEALLPVDFAHVDAFDVTTVDPAAGAAVRVHLYVSDSLASQFLDGLGATSNTIVVTYYAALDADGRPNPNEIARVSLAIGTGPEGCPFCFTAP